MSGLDSHLDNHGNPGPLAGGCVGCALPLPDDIEGDYHPACEPAATT